MSNLVTLEQAHKETRYSIGTLMQFLTDRQITGVKNGKNSLIDLDELKARRQTKKQNRIIPQEDKDVVINLFKTTKNNTASEISVKTGFTINKVNWILDEYLNAKKIQIP